MEISKPTNSDNFSAINLLWNNYPINNNKYSPKSSIFFSFTKKETKNSEILSRNEKLKWLCQDLKMLFIHTHIYIDELMKMTE